MMSDMEAVSLAEHAVFDESTSTSEDSQSSVDEDNAMTGVSPDGQHDQLRTFFHASQVSALNFSPSKLTKRNMSDIKNKGMSTKNTIETLMTNQIKNCLMKIQRVNINLCSQYSKSVYSTLFIKKTIKIQI